MTTWRFLAQRLPGGEWAHPDLPLQDVEITRTLSGPGRLTATIPLHMAGLTDERGDLILTERGIAIWAEESGVIRGGGILQVIDDDPPALTLDCMGYSGYPGEMPWLASDYERIQVDPLDVVRDVWRHLQSFPDGNLGVVVDQTTSPVRVGHPERDVNFETGDGDEVEFETGPYRLSWWETTDLGRELDELAANTPFDYMEHVAWADENHDRLAHRLQLGYPTIGGRRDDLRLAVGENINILPRAQQSMFATEAFVVGAGEGVGMVHAHLAVPHGHGRLRTVARIIDKGADTVARATARGRAELALRTGVPTIEDLQITDHPHAPVGSITPGDEVFVAGSTGWTTLDCWVRVLSVTIRPETGVTSLRVMRTGVAA